jgi:cytochrome P450
LAFDFIYNNSNLSNEIFKLKEQIFLKDLNVDFAKQREVNNETDSRSFFDLMKKVPLPYEEFLEATIFFMGASAETTSSSLANILHLLGMYQDVQNKLYDELKSVLKSEKDYVQEDEMSKMTYLDLVIKESLRLLPVAIMQGRTATKSLKLKKYLLPAGTSTNINTLIIHTDPKYWGEDALEFRPERFLEDHFHNMHPFAYFPFSHGPRMCPGMKYAQMTMKIFLSRFLMKYKVSSPLTYKELKFIFGLTLKTKQDPILFFEKRNK